MADPHVLVSRTFTVKDGKNVATDFVAVPADTVIGARGDPGEQGPRGPQGDEGPAGPRGVQGQKGDAGDTGATGDTGPQGVRGLIGATGARGAQGLKGDTGDRGPRGIAGTPGADGPAGPQGDQGIQGPQGDPGAAGGAPVDAGYLVTASNGDLTAEVVVGATPGGQLGGTWAAPTVDASHSGSTHAATQAAAEATAAADVAGHAALPNVHHAQAHTLTSHSTRAHAELTGVGAADHHTNANDPTAGQKAALAGSSGTPGAGNPYVTDSDARLAGTGVTDHGALTGLADDDHDDVYARYTVGAVAPAVPRLGDVWLVTP